MLQSSPGRSEAKTREREYGLLLVREVSLGTTMFSGGVMFGGVEDPVEEEVVVVGEIPHK